MSNIKSILYKTLPYVIIIIIVVMYIRQCSNFNTLKHQMQHNINALSDSVRHYKTKSGNIAAEKTLLIGDIDLLKRTNDSLYDKLKDMNVKNPQQVVYIESKADYGKRDTVWNVRTENATFDMNKYFDFSNKWRELTGNVSLKDSSLALYIDKDIVYFDYTTAIKDGKVYISSSNPYIIFNHIDGITIPTSKRKYWHIGPSVGVGINTKGDMLPYAGINLTYSLFCW